MVELQAPGRHRLYRLFIAAVLKSPAGTAWILAVCQGMQAVRRMELDFVVLAAELLQSSMYGSLQAAVRQDVPLQRLLASQVATALTARLQLLARRGERTVAAYRYAASAADVLASAALQPYMRGSGGAWRMALEVGGELVQQAPHEAPDGMEPDEHDGVVLRMLSMLPAVTAALLPPPPPPPPQRQQQVPPAEAAASEAEVEVSRKLLLHAPVVAGLLRLAVQVTGAAAAGTAAAAAAGPAAAAPAAPVAAAMQAWCQALAAAAGVLAARPQLEAPGGADPLPDGCAAAEAMLRLLPLLDNMQQQKEGAEVALRGAAEAALELLHQVGAWAAATREHVWAGVPHSPAAAAAQLAEARRKLWRLHETVCKAACAADKARRSSLEQQAAVAAAATPAVAAAQAAEAEAGGVAAAEAAEAGGAAAADEAAGARRQPSVLAAAWGACLADTDAAAECVCGAAVDAWGRSMHGESQRRQDALLLSTQTLLSVHGAMLTAASAAAAPLVVQHLAAAACTVHRLAGLAERDEALFVALGGCESLVTALEVMLTEQFGVAFVQGPAACLRCVTAAIQPMMRSAAGIMAAHGIAGADGGSSSGSGCSENPSRQAPGAGVGSPTPASPAGGPRAAAAAAAGGGAGEAGDSCAGASAGSSGGGVWQAAAEAVAAAHDGCSSLFGGLGQAMQAGSSTGPAAVRLIEQLDGPLRQLAAALHAYQQLEAAAGGQQAQQQAQQLRLRLARAAALRSCSYRRCADLSGSSEADSRRKGRKCTGCRVVRYCSTACQRVDWREGSGHRHVCRLLAAQQRQQGEAGQLAGAS